MTPETLLEILLLASGAETKEEKARIAWRFNDAMWRRLGFVPMNFARRFNDLLQDQKWPWVNDLWGQSEIMADWRRVGVHIDEMIAK